MWHRNKSNTHHHHQFHHDSNLKKETEYDERGTSGIPKLRDIPNFDQFLKINPLALFSRSGLTESTSSFDSNDSYSPIGFLSHSSSSTELSRHSTFMEPSKSRFSSKRRSKAALPAWAIDQNGLKPDITLDKILSSGNIFDFVKDKSGCDLLQNLFKSERNSDTKLKVIKVIVKNESDFVSTCSNTFGNYFMQEIIGSIPEHEEHLLDRVCELLCKQMGELCLEKCACRVIQKALDVFDLNRADQMIRKLPRDDKLVMICNDQNANHVIQKVVMKIPLEHWQFLVDPVTQSKLLEISQDKYGCRVIQTIIEELSGEYAEGHSRGPRRELPPRTAAHREALETVMSSIMRNCQELACNAFANFIIQFILKANGELLVKYRKEIINKCLLTNLLSMSQEKFGSHVVECAFGRADRDDLKEMMEEIFEGYVPHPVTEKDALDIMLFHQFGNYVVQRMIDICTIAVETNNDPIWRATNIDWLRRISKRVNKDKLRLMKFSSGKKIVESLERLKHIMDIVPYHKMGDAFAQY